MTFRFIHTADWQLGKPFANFPSDLAGELSAARYGAIARIAAIAQQRGAAHVLVAGDVFDAEDLTNTQLRRGLERMAEHAALTWVLLPGNHDPARGGGVWDRVRRFGVPHNIRLALDETLIALADGIALLPAPLTSKNPGRDPTAGMDGAVTGPGVVRIGLAHGSVQGFGSDGESSVMIARDRAAQAGLAYLALGDWHGQTRVSAETWYAGTPEPDRYPNNAPGKVLAVTVGNDTGLHVDSVPSAEFTWARIDAALRSGADLNQVEARITQLAASPSNLLVKLALTGSLSLAEHAELDAWREAWAGRLRFLEVESAAVAVAPTITDFECLGSDGPLRDAARSLADAAADATHADHASAALALQRLFGFAAEADRDGAA